MESRRKAFYKNQKTYMPIGLLQKNLLRILAHMDTYDMDKKFPIAQQR